MSPARRSGSRPPTARKRVPLDAPGRANSSCRCRANLVGGRTVGPVKVTLSVAAEAEKPLTLSVNGDDTEASAAPALAASWSPQAGHRRRRCGQQRREHRAARRFRRRPRFPGGRPTASTTSRRGIRRVRQRHGPAHRSSGANWAGSTTRSSCTTRTPTCLGGGAQRGWTIQYVPDGVLRHVHSARATNGRRGGVFLVERNRLLMLTKNASGSLAARRDRRYLRSSAAMVAHTVRDAVATVGARASLRPLRAQILRPTCARRRRVRERRRSATAPRFLRQVGAAELAGDPPVRAGDIRQVLALDGRRRTALPA